MHRSVQVFVLCINFVSISARNTAGGVITSPRNCRRGRSHVQQVLRVAFGLGHVGCSCSTCSNKYTFIGRHMVV